MATRWIAMGMSQALAMGLGVMPLLPLPLQAGAAADAVTQDLQMLQDEGNRQLQQDQLPEAMSAFRKALALARQTQNRKSEGDATNGIGNVQYSQDQKEEALKTFLQALLIRREVKDHRGEAGTLNNIGNVLRRLGKPEEALKTFQQALVLRRDVNDRRGEGLTLNNIAIVLRGLGKPQEALKSFQEALLIRRIAKDRRGEGGTLLGIGNVHSDLGQPEEALMTYQKALLISREVNDRRGEASTLLGIAIVQSNLGQPEEALKTMKQALLISLRVKDRRGEEEIRLGIGNVLSDLDQMEEALKNYKQALLISREVNDPSGQGLALNNIANVQRVLGHPKEALKSFQQALVISRAVKDRRSEGLALNNIANVLRGLGQPEEALKTYQQALMIRRKVKDRRGEGGTLLGIANVQSDLGHPKEALKTFQQTLLISLEVKDRPGEGLTLNNIAYVLRGLGQPEEALKTYQQALLINREVKERRSESVTLMNLAVLQRDQGLGSVASSNLERALELQLEIRRGLQRNNREAFLNQSQWGAATLVELLINQQRPADAFRWVNLFSSVDLADYGRLIDAQLADPEAQRALTIWSQNQAALQAQRQRLERESNERLLQQLVEQEAAQNRAAEALISRYPAIAELLEARPADLERLQAGIPANTVVLQPALLTGVPKRTNTIALFVLTRSSVQVVLAAMPPNFTELLEAYRQDLENGDPYLKNSQQLYDLLIKPVEAKGLLPTGIRLALITTGALRGLPLETLYDGRSEKYLIEKYPMHYLTRLSRTGTADSSAAPTAGGAPRRALVIANPTPTTKPLPGTEEEARYLVGTFPGSRELRGGQATLAQFQQQASRFPILHLGTHGCFLSTGCPELGMKANTLLFANGVNYPIAEAAQLGLANTELLVLAACQTARITSDNNVGVSGLAYVWERAGARAVVASLWSAPDQESSQINRAFYANLQKGLDKAEAMRQAKLALIHSGKEIHPFSWAPFIVIGDAAPLAK
jgi:CHAT domain-containing protein/uncharacterized protein HemY